MIAFLTDFLIALHNNGGVRVGICISEGAMLPEGSFVAIGGIVPQSLAMDRNKVSL